MFDKLSDAFNGAVRKFSGQGRISEANIREAVGDVRDALLEADVQYDVAKKLCDHLVADAIGLDVTKSIKPGQEFINIVNRRLVELMRPPEGDPGGVVRVTPGPTVVMMCGLQGSGKTTTCGKLAAVLAKQGRSCMLAAADLQRPAAIEQLHTIAERVNTEFKGSAEVSFYSEPDKAAEYGKAVGVAVGVCQRAVLEAQKRGVDTVILDTAGRLHVSDELMGELSQIHAIVRPHQVFLVIDAMTGQDAVESAKAFHERLAVDGAILTKFDSDTRGGAAISVREVTGAPLKFMGTGEKLDALEPFHAERIAGRILGMGDVVSLVEKAQQEVSEDEAAAIEAKMAKGELTLDDFLKQLKMVRRMGSMKQLLGMLPGVGSAVKDLPVDDGQLDKVEAIIRSMTPKERGNVRVLDNSRRRRIATGSGVGTHEVSRLGKQFDTVNKMTKQFAGMGAMGKAQAMRSMGDSAVSGAPKLKGSTKQTSPKAKYKKRKR